MTNFMSAFGRGWVKTQNRSLEIVSKLGEFSVEVSCLITRRYRHVGQSIASHDVFEDDFWCESVVEFSHSLDPLVPFVVQLEISLDIEFADKKNEHGNRANDAGACRYR